MNEVLVHDDGHAFAYVVAFFVKAHDAVDALLEKGKSQNFCSVEYGVHIEPSSQGWVESIVERGVGADALHSDNENLVGVCQFCGFMLRSRACLVRFVPAIHTVEDAVKGLSVAHGCQCDGEDENDVLHDIVFEGLSTSLTLQDSVYCARDCQARKKVAAHLQKAEHG